MLATVYTAATAFLTVLIVADATCEDEVTIGADDVSV
jgi:hypothetical protein